MKRNLLLASAITAVALVLVVLVIPTDRNQGERPDAPDVLPAVEETGDDAQARAEFELRRLADPMTGRIPEDIRRRELEFAKVLPRRVAAGKTTASTWEARGPINVGGRTRALAYDAGDPDVVIAGGVSGGIWRSTDGGNNWTKSTSPSDLHSVTAIVQAGTSSDWYAGTGEYTGNSASASGAFFFGDGLFKSTDGGISWAPLPAISGYDPTGFAVREQFVWDLAFDATNSLLYVATYDQILRSNNGGTSFSVEIGGTTNSRYTDVATTSTGIAYAALSADAGASGVWVNTTGVAGAWTSITPVGFPTDFRRVKLAVSPSNEDHVWLLAYTPGGGQASHSLWRYDAGITQWQDFSTLIPNDGGLTGTFDSQGGYDLVIEVHPDDDNLIFIGGTNLYRINVSGTTHTWIGGYTSANNSYALYPNHHPDQHALAFHPLDGDLMLSGSDGGVRETADNTVAGHGNVTWTPRNIGYFTSQFYTICMNPSGSDDLIAGGLQDNGTWSTESFSVNDPWVEEWGGDGAHCAIADRVLSAGKTKWISSQNAALTRKLYNSGDTLDTWVYSYPQVHGGILFIHPFAVDPSNPQVVYFPASDTVGVDHGTIWRTTSAETAGVGTGWSDMQLTGVPTTISAISVSATGSVVYIGTSAGTVHRIDGADTATPPVAPTDVTGASFPGGAWVNDIAINPNDSDEALVVFSSYGVSSLFHTTDAGATWTEVEGNLSGASGPSVRTAAIMPGTGSPYVIGTSVGLYSASAMNGGSTVWMQEAASTIGNVVVDMVRGRMSDGMIVAATHANGVYATEVVLAVELTQFEAVGGEGSVSVAWSTAREEASRGFEIEYRAADSDDPFSKLAFVDGAGESSTERLYRHEVKLDPGTYAFRLKQIDANGTFVYSGEVEAAVGVPDGFLVTDAYPNPFWESARFSVALQKEQRTTIELYDLTGRRVRTLHDGELSGGTTHSFVVDGSGLASGQYVVSVRTPSRSESRSVVLVR
ncbi:MAG: T9SS type A sorting domain-containing protein [Bacteroidetes bacterium]|nr:T9SS type A sorting domain-containing protein [Bacteroidota bacterium]